MRAGSYLSVRNAAVAHTATQIFAPSAAAAALREGSAVIRNLRIVQGAAHTSFTVNSFNPAGAGTATARFAVVRPVTTAHTFTGLNLRFPTGHGCTALGAVGGADGLIQLDGDRVSEYGPSKNILMDVSIGTFSTIVLGGANRHITVHRIIMSNDAAEAFDIGYASDEVGTGYQAITPTLTDAIGDFSFFSRIPRLAANINASSHLVLNTAGASRCVAYVEYSDDPYPQDDGDVRTVVVEDNAGAGTVFVDIHGLAASPPVLPTVLELQRVLGYSSAANGVMTVGYADQGADGTGANYVPLTADITNGYRTDTMAYVCPAAKKLVMRVVYGGAAICRAHVEYRVLAS